jgi:hypothetical protein
LDSGVVYSVTPGHAQTAAAEFAANSLNLPTEDASAAETSAKSLKRVSPGVEVAIITGTGPDGSRDKILAARESPFERTVLLDCDTYVVRDLGPIFELLDRFDVACAHAPTRSSLHLDDIPDSFPEFNTGLIAFRRSETVSSFLADWLADYDRLADLRPASNDQPSFRCALYRSGLRIATLPPEWNQRFDMAGYQNQALRVLHGWGDEARYRLLAAMMTTNGGIGDAQVFSGGRLYREGRLVADFGPPRRLQRIRTALLRRL